MYYSVFLLEVSIQYSEMYFFIFRDTSRVRNIKTVNRKRDKKFHIVTEKWVYDSIEAEKILRERDFEP